MASRHPSPDLAAERVDLGDDDTDGAGAAGLRAQGFALPDGRIALPEHVTKRMLRRLGVVVPRGGTAGRPADLAERAPALRGPLVLKAFGPGLVHKSDLGAVVLDLESGDVAGIAAELAQRLRQAGVAPAGYLVEEQHPAGTELILGVVDRPDVGQVAVLGVGGTLAEVVDRTVTRLCPLDEAGARELVDAFPVPALLAGARGAPPVDREALVDVVLAVAGRDGLAAGLAGDLAELELNPIIATAAGAAAVDARLILHPAPARSDEPGDRPLHHAHQDPAPARSDEPASPAHAVAGGPDTDGSASSRGDGPATGAEPAGARDPDRPLPAPAQSDRPARPDPSGERPAPADHRFERLFRPRRIAVAGASTSRQAFGNRFLQTYRELGWTDGLYALHPTAEQIDGVPAVRSARDVPGGVDYLLVAVPAASCPALVRESAGHAAFVQVMSGGFREAGGDGAGLERELLRAGREAQVRILGPNCMGVYSPAGRQAFQQRDPTEPGRVSVVSQSGGLAGDIVKAGAARGLRFAQLATIGNAVDVGPGELVEHYVDDPDTAVIGLYLEGMPDGRRLVDALRRARGRTPVALLVGGLSAQGAHAVASHTGSMTTGADVWQAVGHATGATVVRTVEELVAVLAYLERYAGADVPDEVGTLVVGPGGGASILSADAADRHGLALVPVLDRVQAGLRDRGYGAGTSLANPVEIPVGPGAPVDAFDPVLDAVLGGQCYADVVLHVNVHAFYSHGDGGAGPLLALLEHLTERPSGARLAVTLRNFECAPPGDVAALTELGHRLRLPLFPTFDLAMAAVAAAKRFSRARTERSGG